MIINENTYEDRDMIERSLGVASLAAFGTEIGTAGAIRTVPRMMGMESKTFRRALKTAKYSKLVKWKAAARPGMGLKYVSAAKGIRMLGRTANVLGWGLLAAELAYGVGKGAFQAITAVGRKELMGTIPRYEDTERAYTERQRAIRAIHSSGQTARSVIGKEAQYLHQ